VKRIAAVANAGGSHLMAMCAIGRELQRRGHEFVLFGTPYQKKQLRVSGMPFRTIGDDGHDPVRSYVEGARRTGSVSISDTVTYMKDMGGLLCMQVPPLLREESIDLVLADQEEPGAATAADLSGLPYVSICNSLPLNEADDIPPGFSPWPYSTNVLAVMRNRLGYAVRNFVVGRVNSALNVHRRKASLKPYRRPDDSFSTRAQITQLVREFDFPRRAPVPALHYVGPFQREPLFPVEFPYDRLDGRPIIYASLGTSFGTRSRELETVAAACSELPVQLVIALGGAQADDSHAQMPGSPLVVSYAPQRELLSRAAVAVTHGGLNTTMEALSLGVPLLAIPLAGDQVGVAARIRWHGVGRSIDERERSAPHVKHALSELLDQPDARLAAQRMAAVIRHSGGAVQAAGIVEQLLQ
jgi:zeaxanthin glucosyltransferase